MDYLLMIFVAAILPILAVLIPVLMNKPRTIKGLSEGLIMGTVLFAIVVLIIHSTGWINYKMYRFPFVLLFLVSTIVRLVAAGKK